jgi:single-strand DNA-binding protein
MAVNKAIIIGNLGQDPQITYSKNGLSVCKFSIATTDYLKKGEKKTNWHKCVAFNKTAEAISEYFSKGNQIYIEGRIDYSSYEKDENKVYTTNIIVNTFSFVSKNNNNNKEIPF